jgi:cysteinyl-tRNA synthetase
MNNYTIDELLYQKQRLATMIIEAKYEEQINFYKKCLNEVNEEINNYYG